MVYELHKSADSTLTYRSLPVCYTVLPVCSSVYVPHFSLFNIVCARKVVLTGDVYLYMNYHIYVTHNTVLLTYPAGPLPS
jgi:hypothetical protein